MERRPDIVRGLANVGMLGLDPGAARDPRLWVPERRIRLPDREIRRVPLIRRAFTTDGTSGIGVPANSTEWATVASDVAAPDFLWLCQEASGNLADTTGGVTLTAASSPSYSNTVTGWSRKGVGFVDASNSNFSSTSASLPQGNTTSFTVMAYISFGSTTPSATHIMFALATSTFARMQVDTSNHMIARIALNTATGTTNVQSTVFPVVMKVDVTNSVCRGYWLHEKLSPTYSTLAATKGFLLGGSAALGSACTFTCMYACGWKGTNAEMSDATIKNMLAVLGWSIGNGWTVSHSASASESDSESESTSVAVSFPIAESESDSLNESAAAVAAYAPTPSESDSLDESAAAVAAFSQAEAEFGGVSVDESTAAVAAFAPTPSESDSLDESTAAVAAFSEPGPAESAAADESADAVAALAASLDEAAVLDEARDVVEAFAPAASESADVDESTSNVAAFAPSTGESADVDELTSNAEAFAPSIVESADVGESASAAYGAALAQDESAGIDEASAVTAALRRALGEATSLAELVVAAVAALAGAEDVASLAEALMIRARRGGHLGGAIALVNRLTGALVTARRLGGIIRRR